ncbi:hypothetical protein CBR_g70693 [Chara braunii]|uniref:Reverse transcriptase domain-containing protein n=1 Tax=Chara braunii TaxID=69332 RepID=A0A388K9T1_CHABU|nr:hypothetical protein CBR_g70693 [Chara braunii]|eukprot:GBG66815.1 hypothetical protein CBR_g70693 [Chara braunii]
MKTKERQKAGKESLDNSMAGEASSSEGGLKKIVSSLVRALNKTQGYLADVKKKLTFDGANITEFLIDYKNLAALLKWIEEEKMDHLEPVSYTHLDVYKRQITEFLIDYKNLAALLKWIEEEKMDHLEQHVSLSLGRDIMAIVAASRFWKETRDVMMRKYLATEKMATEADLAAVQRKNFATYNDFLQEFTLVALRIPGVTDRIMSNYFLRQFSEFDKGKILSAYQQTSKFVNTRDVDFSTVTDLAQKTVVTEMLALLKEGEVIDLISRTGDKVYQIIKGGDIWTTRGTGELELSRRDAASHYHAQRVRNNSRRGRTGGRIIWDQLRGRGPQVNFILESDGRDRVNATTRLGTAGRRIIRDAVMEEVDGSSEPQAEPEAEETEKVYGKPREEEPADKVTAAKKKFRYQLPILTLPELDDTISKLLATMVSVSFQTMMQASPRLLKGLRQLLTRRRVEIGDNPELPEGEREEEAPQEVANLQRSHGDLEDLEKAFADIRLSLPDRQGGEVMRSPHGTKLSFHALPVGKLKIQIGRRSNQRSHKGSSYEFGIAGEVTDLLQAKMDSLVAEPMTSPYANRWFVFRKPNKTLRWIQDLQKLNAVTIRDAGSLPQADLLAESHADRSIYSLIDLYSGYDQLPLDVRDRPYTTMHTPVGQLQMQVTPMGFTNEVAEAQRRMLAVAGDMFPEKCEPYIDDNSIKGAQEKDETEVQPGI